MILDLCFVRMSDLHIDSDKHIALIYCLLSLSLKEEAFLKEDYF